MRSWWKTVYLLHCPTLFPSLSSRASLQTLRFAFFSLDDVGLEKRLFSFSFLLLPRGPCDPSCTKHCILERPGPSRGDGHIHSPTDGAAPNNTCRFIMTKLALLAAHRAGSPAPSGLESPWHDTLSYCSYLYKACSATPSKGTWQSTVAIGRVIGWVIGWVMSSSFSFTFLDKYGPRASENPLFSYTNSLVPHQLHSQYKA